MNCSSFLGHMWASTRLFQLAVSWCPSSSVARSLGHRGQASNVCLLEFASLLQGHVGAGVRREVSILVNSRRSQLIAVAAFLGMSTVPQKGLRRCVGLFMSHSSSRRVLGLVRPHVSVAWVHWHGLLPSPFYANLSARSLPGMFWWDGVLFPRISQPMSSKIPISFKHFLMYSLPLVGPQRGSGVLSNCPRTGRQFCSSLPSLGGPVVLPASRGFLRPQVRFVPDTAPPSEDGSGLRAVRVKAMPSASCHPVIVFGSVGVQPRHAVGDIGCPCYVGEAFNFPGVCGYRRFRKQGQGI